MFSLNGMFNLPWSLVKIDNKNLNKEVEWDGEYYNVVSSFKNTIVAMFLPLDVATHLVESANAKVGK